jgi:hypothetical protein
MLADALMFLILAFTSGRPCYIQLNHIYDSSISIERFNKKLWVELIACFPLMPHGPQKKRWVQQFYCCMCIHCHGNVFTEPLSINDMGIHIQTDWLEGITKYAVEMGSGVMICIRSFIKIGSGIQKLIAGGFTDTQAAWWLHKPAFIFFSK